mmetsp:Transcript_90783/g.235432  ORF Transcript_90783/g.235432 Transcript_90783/m.235432 type:complete len:217 (+) Transcript_90783:1528-2178(+)
MTDWSRTWASVASARAGTCLLRSSLPTALATTTTSSDLELARTPAKLGLWRRQMRLRSRCFHRSSLRYDSGACAHGVHGAWARRPEGGTAGALRVWFGSALRGAPQILRSRCFLVAVSFSPRAAPMSIGSSFACACAAGASSELLTCRTSGVRLCQASERGDRRGLPSWYRPREPGSLRCSAVQLCLVCLLSHFAAFCYSLSTLQSCCTGTHVSPA